MLLLLLSLIPSPLRPSPSHLSSLCLLRALNKQTSSGWLASPIYNSSQSNYKKDVCRISEMHLFAAQGGKNKKTSHFSTQPCIYLKQPFKRVINSVSTRFYSFLSTRPPFELLDTSAAAEQKRRPALPGPSQTICGNNRIQPEMRAERNQSCFSRCLDAAQLL